jgi:hypothetical protein
MNWIDETRRKAFEDHVQSATVKSRGHGRTLDRLLPDHVKERVLPIGNELILNYEDALTAVAVANEYKVAVLGFDAGEVLEDGFQASYFTGYDSEIEFMGDWNSYMALMNAQAERWIKEHPLPKNHGYILTSASHEEFIQLERYRR